nr:hypothetical protein [Rosistilla ulvae]
MNPHQRIREAGRPLGGRDCIKANAASIINIDGYRLATVLE